MEEIVEKLIKINAVGVFNISIGKKVFLKDIVEWLTLYNVKNLTLRKIDKKKNNDSFILRL